MSIWSLTYQQNVFKRYHSDEHFSEFLPTRRRQKTTVTDMEQNYVAVSLHVCILRIPPSPYSITERRVPELIPVLGSQPAGDVSHKPGSRLPLLSARPAVTPASLKTAATNFAAWWTEAQWVWTVCLRLLPDSVATAISAPESSTLTTRLPSQPCWYEPTNPWWRHLLLLLLLH